MAHANLHNTSDCDCCGAALLFSSEQETGICEGCMMAAEQNEIEIERGIESVNLNIELGSFVARHS